MRDIKAVFPIEVELKTFIPYLLTGVFFAVVVIWTSNTADLLLSLIATVFFLVDNKKSLEKGFLMVKNKIKLHKDV